MAEKNMEKKEQTLVGEGRDFERIRRITGYLVGTIDRWNNAKRAEERDRVKHTLSSCESILRGKGRVPCTFCWSMTTASNPGAAAAGPGPAGGGAHGHRDSPRPPAQRRGPRHHSLGPPCLSGSSTGRASGPTAVPAPPPTAPQLGLKVLAGGKVDLVVSGPNYGPNLAGDLLYSGTVSAALEGAQNGGEGHCPVRPPRGGGAPVVQVFVELLSQLDLEKDVRQVLNINVPALPRGKDPGGPVGASGLGHVAGPLR